MATVLHSESLEEEIENNGQPVLVEFTALWCRPCQLLEPVLKQLESEFKEKLKVIKVDVEQNPALTRKYDVRAIPHLLIIEKGQIIERIVGNVTRKQLTDALEKDFEVA